MNTCPTNKSHRFDRSITLQAGAYWIATIALDHADALQGNRLEIIQEGQEGEFQGRTVEARKSLEIRVTPSKRSSTGASERST